jgi:hypothetical protein
MRGRAADLIQRRQAHDEAASAARGRDDAEVPAAALWRVARGGHQLRLRLLAGAQVVPRRRRPDRSEPFYGSGADDTKANQAIDKSGLEIVAASRLGRALADDVVMMCRSRAEAERALVALRAILSELGLTLKDAKTRIVELREGGEGLDFLGFHHRWVRGNTPASRHLCFLARWPSPQAMRHARDRIRELTDRRRLLLPVEDVVQDVNRFLRGWAGYFRYGNSADAFDKITFHALVRLAGFMASVTTAAIGTAGGGSSTSLRIGWD